MTRGSVSAFWPLAAFFVFSSVAFGCMEGWSIATCEVVLFLGAGLVAWTDRGFWAAPRRLWLPALLVAVLVAIGFVQLVPLPAAVWRAAGSDRVSRYEAGAKAEVLVHSDAYRADPFAGGEKARLPKEEWAPLTPPLPSWIPATFTPGRTLKALLALGAGFCLILLLERAAEEGGRVLRRLAGLVGFLGLLVALSAIAFHGGVNEAILGLRASPWASASFGPFVNPNHGMAFVNLTLPLLYYLCWRASLRAKRRGERWGLRALVVALLGVHVAAALVSHSRAAFLALVLIPVAWLLHLSKSDRTRKERESRSGERSYGEGGKRTSRWPKWAAAGYLALLVAGAGWAWAVGLVADSERLRLWSNIPVGRFLVGNGLGSFEARFPAVWRDLCVYIPWHNTHAENEFLQAYFEAGALPLLLALALAGAALFLACRTCLAGSALFWLAPGIAGETVHASVDFTAHVFPIVGAFLLVCAIAIHGVEKAGSGNGEETGARARKRSERWPEPVPKLP